MRSGYAMAVVVLSMNLLGDIVNRSFREGVQGDHRHTDRDPYPGVFGNSKRERFFPKLFQPLNQLVGLKGETLAFG